MRRLVPRNLGTDHADGTTSWMRATKEDEARIHGKQTDLQPNLARAQMLPEQLTSPLGARHTACSEQGPGRQTHLGSSPTSERVTRWLVCSLRYAVMAISTKTQQSNRPLNSCSESRRRIWTPDQTTAGACNMDYLTMTMHIDSGQPVYKNPV
jgi:hypothetical protein